MSNQSGLMRRFAVEIQIQRQAAMVEEQAFCLDVLTAMLGRMGYGEKRLSECEKLFSEIYLEYDALRKQDEKTDREAVYYKSVIDRELKQYCGSKFLPYDERHNLKGRRSP